MNRPSNSVLRGGILPSSVKIIPARIDRATSSAHIYGNVTKNTQLTPMLTKPTNFSGSSASIGGPAHTTLIEPADKLRHKGGDILQGELDPLSQKADGPYQTLSYVKSYQESPYQQDSHRNPPTQTHFRSLSQVGRNMSSGAPTQQRLRLLSNMKRQKQQHELFESNLKFVGRLANAKASIPDFRSKDGDQKRLQLRNKLSQMKVQAYQQRTLLDKHKAIQMKNGVKLKELTVNKGELYTGIKHKSKINTDLGGSTEQQ